jgi:hypothetical protein
VSENLRVERGWIIVNGTRRDDALSQRQDTRIGWGHVLTASVQRLAFWRR